MDPIDLTCSPDGCTITLHCAAKSKMTLRAIYMVSSDAVKRCVSRDQRQSRGALGFLNIGTLLVVDPAMTRCLPISIPGTSWWISITEKATSFGTKAANANNILVQDYFLNSHYDSKRGSWQKFRGPGRAPAAGGALGGQGSPTGSPTGSNEVNNHVGQVVPAHISQPDAYSRDFPPL